MSVNWYVIQAKAQSELVAKVNLENQGFEVYLPMTERRRRIRNKPVLKIEALFPGYIFILLDTTHDNWAPIRSTRGVIKLVRFGLEPGRVPDDLITLLKDNEMDKMDTVVNLNQFKVGDKVRVATGPLAGYEGVFQEQNGSKRAMILLNLINNFTKIQVDLDAIDKSDD
jgi:transcriptional antiterminator RfaH